MENSDLSFSPEGLLSRAALYGGVNDINLYVEDENSQYLYETVFKRLLGSDYKISTIFPCGSKPNVIKAFQEFGEQSDGIKNVYLADGDFDAFLFPDRMVINDNFVYLRKYNIENYLINENGANSIVKSKMRLVDSEVQKVFNYADWKNQIVGEAKELFLCYCYIQKFVPEVKNVDRSCYEFIDRETGFKRLDGNFENYRESLYQDYPNSKEEIEKIRHDFEDRFGNEYDIIICGKFLMASLFSCLRKITRSRIDNSDALWKMVETFDTSSLEYVKNVCLSN